MPDKNYQPNYKPSPFSSESLEGLHKSITRGGGDLRMAMSELERVAGNIAAALENEETPEIVRNQIKSYVHDLVSFDFTDYRETVIPLYVFACRKISQIPFIPQCDYIEALTGNNKSKAVKEAKESKPLPFQSITVQKAQRLVKAILLDNEGGVSDEERPFVLAALVYAVGNEPHPFHRDRLVNRVLHQTFFETLYFSDEFEGFEEKAIKYTKKFPKTK